MQQKWEILIYIASLISIVSINNLIRKWLGPPVKNRGNAYPNETNKKCVGKDT